MITISVNGESRNLPDSSTLADLLRELKINNRYCAVERNREVIPREQHADCRLSSSDVIEIVTLVGGG